MPKVLKIVNSIKPRAPNNRKLCVMVTLDIHTAFESAHWKGIKTMKEEQRHERTDYLSERSVLVRRGMSMQMECGMLQGAILGPILLNIFYNSALTMDVPTGTSIIGFADDTTAIYKAKTELKLVSITNPKKSMKLAVKKP
ncbi:hypothetical protein HUJ04_008206 [Dendroctonus ponderosae]|nr:hypothetical protein HUJ04_008204 [Dendroctonus ponderosae]KAH0999973.1 hypothetical protein HUJ04_008206 [Dendroctonus ponderosae]